MELQENRRMAAWCGLVCALLLAAPIAVTDVSAQEGGDWEAWSNHRGLSIDLSKVGVTPSSDITGFPLLVRLDATRCPGFDIAVHRSSLRFSELDGTELPYQIESWDESANTAEVWVKVSFEAGRGAKAILMHWGNDEASSQSDGAAVFGGEAGFRRVYHLKEENTNFVNATSGADDGESHVTSTGKLGVIGKGQQFTKDNGDYVEAAENQTRNVTAFTLSAWVRQDEVYRDWDDSPDLEKEQWIAGSRRWWEPSGYQLLSLGTQICATVAYNPHWYFRQRAFSQADTWYHAAVTWSAESGELAFYINGAVHDSAAELPAQSLLCDEGVPFRISVPKTDTRNSGYNGYIDEVRDESVARSPEWIKLCFENQKPNSGLVTFFEDGYLPLVGGTMYGDIVVGGNRVAGDKADDASYLDFPGAEGEGARKVRLHAADGSGEESEYAQLEVVPGTGVNVEGSDGCTLNVDGEVKAKSMSVERIVADVELGDNEIARHDGENEGRIMFKGTGAEPVGVSLVAANVPADDWPKWTEVTVVPSGGVIIKGGYGDEKGTVVDVQGELKAESIRINDWRLSQKVPDYVFGVYDSTDGAYDLKPLSEVEEYVRENRHLPGIESAETIGEKGLDMVEMQLGLLRYMEETTLRLIDMEKTIDSQRAEIAELRRRLENNANQR